MGNVPRMTYRRVVTAIAAAGLIAIQAGSADASQNIQNASQDGGPESGVATNYAPTPEGNCSYPNPPSNQLYVALSPSEYDNGAACGEYVDVNGPHGTVRAEVTDQCPECGPGHVDLSQPAFSKIAPLPKGEVPVSYTKVTNPPLTAPIAVKIKEGSSPNWLALLPMNTGNPLTSVQVQNHSGGWDNLTQSGYGYWIAQQGEGPGPFTIKLTDTNGNTATVNGINLSPGNTQTTNTWMYGSGNTSALPGNNQGQNGQNQGNH